MDSVSKLKRFFYLGSLAPVYVPKRKDHKFENDFEEIRALVCDLDAATLISLIEIHTQRQGGLVPRNDEALYVYAVYLSEMRIERERVDAYRAFPQLIPTSAELFTFAHYAKVIQGLKKRKGFTQTVRKAFSLWYTQRTEMEMVDMLAVQRSKYGFMHKDLIAMCHVDLKKAGKQDLIGAMFRKPSKAVVQNEGIVPVDAQAMAKLQTSLTLKACAIPADSKELITTGNLKFGNVPTNMLAYSEVWDALLPSFTYRQILEHMFTLIEQKVFQHVSPAFTNALLNETLMIESSITPVLMLKAAKSLMTEKRYSERIKQTYHTQRIERLGIRIEKSLVDNVTEMFKKSFDHNQRCLGLKFFIAINMQASYSKKPVINQRQIACVEAAVTMALMYSRTESKVDVFTYTPQTYVLEHIDWKENISYDDAMLKCKEKEVPKTVQRLTAPFNMLNKKTDSYDVILIIVPSGARGNPLFKPDKLIKSLMDYRKQKQNDKARLIIVNLRRYTPAMIHGQTCEDNGILEICGFNENTVKLIDAYATHAFS